MKSNVRGWVRLALCLGTSLVMFAALLTLFSSAGAWSEENIQYFDPLDYRPLEERDYVSPTVSSVHFDLVGALVIAAGFSVTDAARIQAYSEATDAGPLPEENPVYDFDANPANYPVAPPISSVVTSTICPSPTTTGPTVTMGAANLENMECPGCFTDRFGPYGVFFHMPHESADELGAIRDWALGVTDTLIGKVTFGYSSTTTFEWQEPAYNIYETTPCFVQEYHVVDTGSIRSGSLEAFAIYLHSYGDTWSHKDCIAAADALGLPFAAHVKVDSAADPLWDCRWTHHKFEFGDPRVFPDSNRTYSGTLALYDELVRYALASDLPIYRPIPLTAEGNHIQDALYAFVHTTSAARPQDRRVIADALRTWALETRAGNPAYWRFRTYLPELMR